MEKVVVIGGGLSGLALSTELLKEDFEVEILEKNPQLGGRARTENYHEGSPLAIGPHVFMKIYYNFFQFADTIGAEDIIDWSDNKFMDIYADGEWIDVTNSSISAPTYKLPLKFVNSVGWINSLRIAKFALKSYFISDKKISKLDEITVEEYLRENNLPKEVVDNHVTIFTEGLLNTHYSRCSAGEFANLLRGWLRAEDRSFGFAKGGLGDIFAGNAEEFIEDEGGIIRKETEVEKLIIRDGKIEEIKLTSGETITDFDRVVSTLNPLELNKILPEDSETEELKSKVEKFTPAPYYSVFLFLDTKITDKKVWSILDSDYLNTDFYDKSNHEGFDKEKSLIASNIINPEDYGAMSEKEVVNKTVEELRELFPQKDFEVEKSFVHQIPYAIYEPLPGKRKNKIQATELKNFEVTGDWTSKKLPQCMEAAVKTGYLTAEKILSENNKEKEIADKTLI